MRIKFLRRTVQHQRKQPRPSIVNQNSFFGVPGKVLSYQEAMILYHKIQDFLDLWDVETEIDYREEEGGLTKEEARWARNWKREIAEEYRGRLDEDGHWNDVLMGVINWTIGR